MTLQEAIDKRIARFNELYLKAVGHTFEEDEKWCEDKVAAEKPAWEEKVKARLAELGYDTVDSYFDAYHENQEEVYDKEFFDIWESRPMYMSNYSYEKFCIDEAAKIVNFIRSKGEDTKAIWDKYAKQNEEYVDTFNFIKAMEADGFKDFDQGHSGNTAGQSVMFAQCLLFHPVYFPYLHGAITPLVGDEGYHDDRSDIPPMEELEELDKQNPLT